MTTQKTLVSVILCNYNYDRYLAESIESVLMQSYRDFELIIVDDGSTDGSREIISRYRDSRVRTLFKDNGGQASAFNAGMEQARGELVAFLDSDDAWTPDKLSRTVEAMADGKCSIVQHNLYVFDEASAKSRVLHPRTRPGSRDVLRAYLRNNDTDFFSVTSGIVCRRRDLDRIFPLDPAWRICADVAVTRPLPHFGLVRTLPEVLGYYRIHGANHWMNSVAQRRVHENLEREFEYVNLWLERFGYRERIDFEASRYHTSCRMQSYPSYHPLRVGHALWTLSRDRIASPLALRLSMISIRRRKDVQ